MRSAVAPGLPSVLRERRDVLDQWEHWATGRVAAAGRGAAVLVRGGGSQCAVWALGDADELTGLLPGVLTAEPAGPRWVTAPRATHVPPAVLARAGLVHRSSWDRFSVDVAPAPRPGEGDVVLLDVDRDAAALTACLDLANPTTHARPGAPDDAAWWGVRDGNALVGVVGAAWRSGRDGSRSVHLHGLGVVPTARGRGLGTALVAVATRHALAGGAPWVALGMYSDNAPARRVYAGLGYRVDAENAGYGPPGTDRP